MHKVQDMKRKHIDDVQTLTIDEHLKLIIQDESVLDPELTDITPHDIPEWYNEKLFKEGQNYYKQNMLLAEITYLIGLISVLAIPTIYQVLTCTKQNSTSCAAFKRDLKVQMHVFIDMILCDPSDPHSNWYKSINVIRWKHNISTKISKKANLKGILQKDMALTQCALIMYIFIVTKSFGLRNKLKEEEGINHFWRIIGYMLGISDKLNICRKNAMETRELCQKIVNNVFANYLNNVSSEFYHLISTILDELGYWGISLNKDVLLALLYRLHNIEYKTPLGWYNWLNMKYRDLIFKLYFVPYIGTVIRIYYNFMMMLIFWSATLPVFKWLYFGSNNFWNQLYSDYKEKSKLYDDYYDTCEKNSFYPVEFVKLLKFF